MNRLLKIARSAVPGTDVQFREQAYGRQGIRRFLRDVLAIANADVDGNRYIVTGVQVKKDNQRHVHAIDLDDFSGKPFYQALVAEFIEPPIAIKYRAVVLDGKRVGVFEIGDCQDKPYMMRVDHSEKLRRGDAYMRVNSRAIKIGRRVLFGMFESRVSSFGADNSIEIGFPGEVIQKKRYVPTVDLTHLPSAAEHAKLSQLIDVRQNTKDSGSTTTMARMVHMRLFGADDPYEDRSPTTLLAEMEQIRQNHEAEDHHFLFEENAQKLQLVAYHQGETPIQNASITLVMPNHDAFFVATSLAMPGDSIEFADYPTVSKRANKIYVSSTVGDIPVGAPIDLFELPLRYCIGSEMNGKQMTMQYRLFGSNLRQPVEGKLSLAFSGAEIKRQNLSSGG